MLPSTAPTSEPPTPSHRSSCADGVWLLLCLCSRSPSPFFSSHSTLSLSSTHTLPVTSLDRPLPLPVLGPEGAQVQDYDPRFVDVETEAQRSSVTRNEVTFPITQNQVKRSPPTLYCSSSSDEKAEPRRGDRLSKSHSWSERVLCSRAQAPREEAATLGLRGGLAPPAAQPAFQADSWPAPSLASGQRLYEVTCAGPGHRGR